MTNDILDEILNWVDDQPDWQKDAIGRLLIAGSLDSKDVDELTERCKAAHGLSPHLPESKLPSRSSLPPTPAEAPAVSLRSVTHRKGVNALARDQTIKFGQRLTIAFGENAAGKSGYTRILKGACRARSSEPVLSNVLSDVRPSKGQATIAFETNGTEKQYDWSSDVAPTAPLTAVSVFDSHCAAVYLRDKTDVAFRPFGLDLFDKLSVACGEVRKRLEAELRLLERVPYVPPPLPEGSESKKRVASPTSLADTKALEAWAELSIDELERLDDLERRSRDAQSNDPKKRALELTAKAVRFDKVAAQVALLIRMLGRTSVDQLEAMRGNVIAARNAVGILQKAVAETDYLPGTGGDAWRRMFESAESFARQAGQDTICPLCQQLISSTAAERFRHFREYVSSEAQTRSQEATEAFDDACLTIRNALPDVDSEPLFLEELEAEDAVIAASTKAFFDAARKRHAEMTEALKGNGALPSSPMPESNEGSLRRMAKAFRERAEKLRSDGGGLSEQEVGERKELQARNLLKEGLPVVLAEIERKKKVAAYGLCLSDVGTAALTRKSTDLTKRLITEELKKTFQGELLKLKFQDLPLEIQDAGGSKGSLLHRIAFKGHPGVVPTTVLSEGESRALSLAAFITELSTASAKSAIIFDDPVSSLDHNWRRKIAARLVEESKDRQVIVFTHDLMFFKYLDGLAASEGVDCFIQHGRRIDREAGFWTAEGPWVAMKAKRRMGVIRNEYQAAEKLYRLGKIDAYEREAKALYNRLRETWESSIPEVLLHDVVEPYRSDIMTKEVRYLSDITEQDCRELDAGMTECSRWAHTRPAAEGAAMPEPLELKNEIEKLDAWIARINARRNT